MALLIEFFTALLLLQFGLQLNAGSETLSCPAPAGVPGTPGHSGLPGRDGRDGRDGKEGAAGAKGEKGELGLSVQGPPGKAGPPGPEGPTGAKGQKGDQGLSGNVANDAITSLQSELQGLKGKLARVVEGFQTIKKVGRKLYVSDGLQANFDEAVKFCAGVGGTPVLPRNEAENQALTKIIADMKAPSVYVGADDRVKEGQFVDLNDVPLTFTKWRNGEPNNHANAEHCAGVYSGGEWNDFPCNSNVHTVCEIEIL